MMKMKARGGGCGASPLQWEGGKMSLLEGQNVDRDVTHDGLDLVHRPMGHVPCPNAEAPCGGSLPRSLWITSHGPGGAPGMAQAQRRYQLPHAPTASESAWGPGHWEGTSPHRQQQRVPGGVCRDELSYGRPRTNWCPEAGRRAGVSWGQQPTGAARGCSPLEAAEAVPPGRHCSAPAAVTAPTGGPTGPPRSGLAVGWLLHADAAGGD